MWACVCVCVCMHVCKQRNPLSISMSVHTTQAWWSLTQRALSCVCVLYWLSEGSMQHFYLWLISPGLQAHWVLFDWVLWPLVIKVGSWETIDHCTGNLTQFRRCTVPGRLCLQKTHRVLHSRSFTHKHTHTHTRAHCPKSTVCSAVSDNSSLYWGRTV